MNGILGFLFSNKSNHANSYWWDFGDGTGANNTSPCHYYADPGTYLVTLSAFSSICTDTSTYAQKITILNETTGLIQTREANDSMFISRDREGYYVQFNYTTKAGAIICIYDLLGQKIGDQIKVENITDKKIHVNISSYENRSFIISAVSTLGQKIYRKIIN